MHKYKSFILVAITNIIGLCLIQIIYWSILIEVMDMAIFQFIIIIPLIVIVINIILWCSKFKLGFYQHAIFAYIAFYLSFIVSLFMSMDSTKELPPGEIVLFADVLLIIFITIVQLIILLVFNLLLYILYRFSKRNKKFQSRDSELSKSKEVV